MRALALASILFTLACAPAYTSSDESACTRLAAAKCAKIDQCEHDGVANEYGDEATCEARLLAQCKAAFGASHTGAHAATMDTCTDALPAASCGDFELDTLDACQPEAGTLATGKACGLSTQCGSGFCALAVHGACGTCQPPRSAGADCSTAICSPGFACSPTSKTCQPYGAPGADCNADEPCAFSLTCVTPSGATTGSCVGTAANPGDACDPAHASGPDCDALRGLACDPGTSQCVALTYATAGQPCGNVSGTIVACSKESSCIGGTCVAYAADGAACDVVAGPACSPPATCVTSSPTVTQGTCALPGASACT